MKPRLKALLKELKENSGHCFHCSSNIELSTVKRLLKKHWPTEGAYVEWVYQKEHEAVEKEDKNG